MNRGRNKDNIFHDKSDFQLFLNIIGAASVEFNAIVHCYCGAGGDYSPKGELQVALYSPKGELQITRFL